MPYDVSSSGSKELDRDQSVNNFIDEYDEEQLPSSSLQSTPAIN